MTNSWGQSNNLKFINTGKFFIAKIGAKKGKIGELVNLLSWGGLILEFTEGNDKTHITYDITDVEEVKG